MTTPDASLYDSFALYGSGVTLISVRDGDVDRFFVAASVLTASVDPFAIAVSVGRDRDALPAIEGGAPWVVSVLTEQHAPLVAQLTEPGTRAERREALDRAGARTSATGTGAGTGAAAGSGPLWLPDALVSLSCTTRSTTDVHNQVIVVGDVIHGSALREGRPLLRWNRGFHTVHGVARPSRTTAA